MKRATWLLLAAVLIGGCRADILKRDQIEIRQALLDMYQDEVMDNLIRTKLMLPVIQVDYHTMTGTMTSLTKGIGGYSKEADRNQFGAAAGSVTPVHVTKTFPSITGEQDESTQLTLTGEPVCDDKLYEAYEEYLYGSSAKAAPTGPHEQPATMPTTVPATQEEKSAGGQLAIGQQPSNSVYTVVLTTPVRPVETHEPVPQGQLLVSDKPPAEGTYHVMKEFRGKYYYVPPDSAKAFFALYRRVVLARKAAPTTGENLGNELQLFRLNQLQ